MGACLWSEFEDIETKNKSVCENAVTQTGGSCLLRVMCSWFLSYPIPYLKTILLVFFIGYDKHLVFCAYKVLELMLPVTRNILGFHNFLLVPVVQKAYNFIL